MKKDYKYLGIDYKNADEMIDIDKGCFVGWGINLRKKNAKPEPIYIPWDVLDAPLMIFGTTRQGKSRLLIFIVRQIIEKGSDICVVDPKGSKGNEILSWMIQYANEFKRLKDFLYFSPAFPLKTENVNPIYGMGDEEVASTIVGNIEAKEPFYKELANQTVMAALLGISFLERMLDPLIVEMIRTMEYAKVKTLNRVENTNKILLKEAYRNKEHRIDFDIRKHFLSKDTKDETYIARVNDAYKWVTNYYATPTPENPVRTFVTFRDLSIYSDHAAICDLYEKVTKAFEEARKRKLSAERRNVQCDISDADIALGSEALQELKKMVSKDPANFSRVIATFSSIMTKLSTGDIGAMLCDSKINILRDRVFSSEQGVLMLMQPFPLKYDIVADTVIKIFMSMFSSFAGHIGISGKMTPRRMYVFIDEAGAVANQQIAKNLANKGGGLGFSLGLFSQSIADYVAALGEESSAILNDNANTKGFFKVNDPKSQGWMSEMIGPKKVGQTTYSSSDNRDGRAQSKADEEALIPSYLVGQLKQFTWALKVDSDVYMMMAPWQEDPHIYFKMPVVDLEIESLKMSALLDEYTK